MSELARIPLSTLPALPPDRPLAPEMTFAETMQLGEVLAQSGYFADARDAAQAVVKILYGAELGIGPISAMMGVDIIQGKPVPSTHLLAAIIRRSGVYGYKVLEKTDERCCLAFQERGQEVARLSWNLDDARRAGLLTKENWQKYPRMMLFWRCLSEGIKTYFPDLFGGAPVYTAEELEASADLDTGEVIEQPAAPPAAVPAAPAAPREPGFANPRAQGAVENAEKGRYARASGIKPEPPAAAGSRLMSDCERHLQSLGLDRKEARPFFARVLGRDVEKFADLQRPDWEELERLLKATVKERRGYLAAWGDFAKAYDVEASDRVQRLEMTATLLDYDGVLHTSTRLTAPEYARVAEGLRERVRALGTVEREASRGERESDPTLDTPPSTLDDSADMSADMRAFQ